MLSSNKQRGSILKYIAIIIFLLATASVILYLYSSSRYDVQTPRTVSSAGATWTLRVPDKLEQGTTPNDGTFNYNNDSIVSLMVFSSTQPGSETIEKSLLPQLKSTKLTENTLSANEELKIGYKYGVDDYQSIDINGDKAVYTEKRIDVEGAPDRYAEGMLASVSTPCGIDGLRICSVWAFTNDSGWSSLRESLIESASSIKLK